MNKGHEETQRVGTTRCTREPHPKQGEIQVRVGQNVIKLFTDRIYEFLQLDRLFVPGNPFQPSLMFADKARAYLSEPPSRYSTSI